MPHPMNEHVLSGKGRLDTPHSFKARFWRVIWAGVEMTLFRGSFHTFNGWRVFLLRCFGARIGRNCRLHRTCRVYFPWNIHLGNEVIIGNDANLYSLGMIKIGDRTTVSQEAYLAAGTHDYTRKDF